MEAFTQGLTTLLEGITDAADFLWSIFAELVTTIMTEPLFALPVLFALAAGGVMVTIKIVKGFGMRGKSGKKPRG